ncbi:MAG: proton-conducting transporter membrane subunit [Chloroflexota bacterium]
MSLTPLGGPLLAVGILVFGAVLVLVLVNPTSRRPSLAPLIGVPFAVGAAVVGAQAPQPLGLAVIALCGMAGIAVLLLPALHAEVPAHVAEAAALLLLGAAGALALASATDLLQAVVGLETLALSAVILVALGVGDRSLEAAFKYFVLGAVSLAGLLYGLGLVYLGTGSFGFPSAAEIASNPLILAGVVLVGMGFAFELALFPFHWGALDAYTAADPSLAGFVMSASKLAAAFALGRLVQAAGVELAQPLIWIGSLTIVWGTFGALAQAADFRRMLGYSAITHAGFIGLALGSGPNGPQTAAFYATMYGSMAMLVFAGLAGSRGTDLRGLGRLRATGLGLGLLSLSGVPPTPGFWAKLAVLVVAWQAAGPVPTLIAVAGGVFSVLYYLRPLPDLFAALRGERLISRAVVVPGVVVATVVVVGFGVFPGLIWTLAHPS